MAQNHIGLFLPFFFSTLSRSILLHFGPSLASARLSTHLAMWTHIPSPPSCLSLIVQKDLLSTLPFSLPPFRRILHSLPLTEGRREGGPQHMQETPSCFLSPRGEMTRKKEGGKITYKSYSIKVLLLSSPPPTDPLCDLKAEGKGGVLVDRWGKQPMSQKGRKSKRLRGTLPPFCCARGTKKGTICTFILLCYFWPGTSSNTN